MSVNSKLDRLRERRDQLKAKMSKQIQNGQLLQVSDTARRIKDVEAAIEEAESYLPKKLSELFDQRHSVNPASTSQS